MNNQTRTPEQLLWGWANSYLSSARILQETLDDDQQGPQRVLVGMPLITLYAFAAELAMKSLYFAENKKEYDYIHDLCVIFSSLESDIQESLTNSVCAELCIVNPDFYQSINDHRNAFVSWRYPGKSKSASINFLKVLSEKSVELASRTSPILES